MNAHHDNYNTFTKLQMDNKQNDNTTTLPSAPVSSIRVDRRFVPCSIGGMKRGIPRRTIRSRRSFILYRIHGRQI